ncbi:endonuclease domain-containing protein [Kocuria sp.]|uniref:endonuclease domain-containing protein n=1 Tax=Kocuria sp. TaxID=1871328 RepID=UPI0026E01D5C|nr:DUF559 domain-containing protein [Kocuria sp.]MDO5618010.1 DUF559 domain-containing protein [Kocuria sp.]
MNSLPSVRQVSVDGSSGSHRKRSHRPQRGPVPERLLTSDQVMENLGRYPRAITDGRDPKLGLLRVQRNAWADESWWKSLSSWQRVKQEHLAVNMAARHPLTFCRESAALLHGWPVLSLPHRPHAVVGHQRTGSHRTDRTVAPHLWHLSPEDVQPHGAAFVTVPARTAADCARELASRDAVVMLDHFLRVGGRLDQVEMMLTASKNRRGVRRARAALRRANGLAESPGETLTRLMLEDHGVDGFTQQLAIMTAGGRHRVDFAWEREKVILEFDGGIKYSGKYGSPGDVIRLERQREKDLTNAGWRVIRVNWDTVVRSPLMVVQLIRAELHAASHSTVQLP